MGDKEKTIESVSETKAITLTPLLTDLFRPTAQLLGDRLQEFTRDTLDSIRRKKEELNLEFHLRKVQELLEQRPPELDSNNSTMESTLANAERLVESINAVKEVDPEDEELSTLWHHLIADLKRGKSLSKLLLAALRDLSGPEAAMLLKLRDGERIRPVMRAREVLGFFPVPAGVLYGPDSHLMELLVQKNLLRRSWGYLTLWVSLLLLSILGYFSLAFGRAQNMTGLFPGVLLLLGSLFSLPYIYFSLAHGSDRYLITWLGKELLRFAPPESQASEHADEDN